MSGGTTIVLTATTPPSSGAQTVSHTSRTTFSDMTASLRDYLGSNVNNEARRAIVRACLDALRELVNVRPWSYLYYRGRLQTNGQYTTGTIQFQTTGGAYTNQLTLSSGTWPTWTNLGTLAISNVTYEVVRRISSTIAVMDTTVASAADIAAGTAYTLYQDTYTLPEDFVASDKAYAEVSWGGMEYVHPNLWLQTTRYYRSSSNTPRYYTFTGDPRVPGRMCMRLFPYPDQDRTIDLLYHRRPRKLALESYTTGTVSVDASSGSTTTVTGSGTSWTSAMVGSVIRLSANATATPTGIEGSNASVVERNVVLVNSATSITVDDSITTSYTGVAYEISDPIDVEDGAMLEAYRRCCEKHVAIQRNQKNIPLATQLYLDALIRAEEADSRAFSGRVAGEGGPYRQRLANMPRGSDIS